MTAPSSKNARITIYYALLVAYTIFIMKFGGQLFVPFGGMPSLLLGTRPQPQSRRKTMRHSPNVKKDRAINRKIVDNITSNEFLMKFTETLSNNQTLANNFAALILHDDKLYCRKSQMNSLSRGRYFVQMLRQGLLQHKNQSAIIDKSTISMNGIPILIKHDDSNGCYPSTHSDKYGFPRLTWSVPATSSPSSWCSAIGMPSYKVWRDLQNDGNKFRSAVMNNNDAYPWNEKVSLAIWRGSTTCNKGLYGHLPFLDTPRSRLVKLSMEMPDLIDAGFHKVVGKYDDISNNVKGRIMKEVVPLNDMMRYKAIIDIDGNNWSARFPSLLCTNSVVIKIAPDFVDQTMHDLQPNVHYIPSSLGNLTTVVEYIMDKDHDGEMKKIVSNANRWCLSNMSIDSLARRAIDSLETYMTAIDQLDENGWTRGIMKEFADDLVECNV